MNLLQVRNNIAVVVWRLWFSRLNVKPVLTSFSTC